MAEAAWAAIGLQAATLFGLLSWLGSKIDNVRDTLAARIDGQEVRFDAINTRIDGLSMRIDGLSQRLDAHVEWHAC